jgi:PKD repeat protein/regulation of enolase protein 1 (concanavalin A-like superfamily)
MSDTPKWRFFLAIMAMAFMFSIAVPYLHAQTPIYDEFDDGITDPAWTFQSYDGDYREQNGFIEIDSGSRDVWTNQYDPTWVYQEFEGDFDVYTRVVGCTVLDANYKHAGILVEESSANFVKIARLWENGSRIHTSHITNNSLSRSDHDWVAEAGVIYLRVKRAGSEITTYYSENGVNWVLHLPTAPLQTSSPVKVGLFATHIGATQFTVKFDYFRNHPTNPLNYVPVVADEFTGVNDDLPDPDKWTISWRDQTPPNLRIYEGKLEASNQDGWRDCRSRYYVKGDFDVVVDFNFPIYSTQEGWGAGIVARALQNEQNKYVVVDKGISAGQERYRMYADGADRGVSINAAQSGRLRLTRIGNQFRGHYWHSANQAWIVYSIYTPADFGESAFISLWTAHWGGNPNTVVDFDNFGIVTGDASVYIDQPTTDLFQDSITAGFWNWEPDGGGNHRELEREHEVDSGSGDLWDGIYDPCWLYQPIKGDFDVYTKVEDVETGDYRRAGLHFRVDNRNWMGCWVGSDAGLSVSTHHTVDGITQGEKIDWSTQSGWLRVNRVDSDITGYYWDAPLREWVQLAPPTPLYSDLDGQIGILANHPFSSQFTAKFRLFANTDFWHEDHFNDAEIDPMWNIYPGDHANVPGEVTENQGWLHLRSSNDGGVNLDDTSCTRALARISGDFDIKVRLQVPSLWDESQHFNFIYVHDDSNWAGFQRGYTGYNMLEFAQLTYDSYEVIASESWDPIHFYLRLKKVGTIITGYESEDGLNWNQIGSYDESWVNDDGYIGFYAGQGDLDVSYQFTAKINWILEEVTSTEVANNLAPTAVAQADVTSGLAPLTVNFDGSASSDPENQPLEYFWVFGEGGGFSEEASPTYIYQNPGVYEVRLTVMDEADQIEEDSVTITVLSPNTPPVADAGPDQDILVNDVISLQGSASDPDGDPIVEWSWTVESQPSGSEPVLSSRVVPEPEFSTATPGEYILSLVVNDDTDASLPDYVTIQVRENLSPTAVAHPEEVNGPVPLAVQFDGSASSDPENRPLEYSWDFGDGSDPSSDPSPEHVYSVPGIYKAKLVVTDHAGVSGEDTVTITVVDSNEPPTASPTATPDTGSAPLSVTFLANASDPDGDDLTYLWNFGDGTTSIEENPIHIYAEADTYMVSLTVSDGELDANASLTVVVKQETGLSVRYARVKWKRNRRSLGSIILLGDFDFATPAPEDIVRITFDNLVLFEEPLSNFKRSFFNRRLYRLYRRNLLVSFNFKRKIFTVLKWKTDISLLDSEDGVDVELSMGSAAASENITMRESSRRRLIYRRPR